MLVVSCWRLAISYQRKRGGGLRRTTRLLGAGGGGTGWGRVNRIPSRSGDVHTKHGVSGAAGGEAVEFFADGDEPALEVTSSGGFVVAEDDQGDDAGGVGGEGFVQEQADEFDAEPAAALIGADNDVAEP